MEYFSYLATLSTGKSVCYNFNISNQNVLDLQIAQVAGDPHYHAEKVNG
jgi:hypothetical protein